MKKEVKITDLTATQPPKSNYAVNINAVDLTLTPELISKGAKRRWIPVKNIIAELEKLRNPSMWKVEGAGGQDKYAGLPPAIRVIDEILKKLE